MAGANAGMMSAQNSGGASAQAMGAKALVFDTFGTVVDWRSSVAREVEALAKRKGVTLDAAKFADAWRAGYGPSMNRVRSGELPWTKLDALHRMTLDKILIDFKLAGLNEEEKDALNRGWHRLTPWPDAVSGLTRLKKKFIIAPLSNGNISLMTDLAKHSGLPWDVILGAELVRHYKPDREVYQSAADILDLKPADVMMVAAHLGDLRAAKQVGLRTAFVVRPRSSDQRGKPDPRRTASPISRRPTSTTSRASWGLSVRRNRGDAKTAEAAEKSFQRISAISAFSAVSSLSVLSQRDSRVDADGAPGREGAGGQRRHHQHGGGPDERDRIERLHREQERAEQSRQHRRGDEADRDTRPGHLQRAAEHQPQHVVRSRAQRDADAELACPLADRKGEHAEDADRRQHQRERSEDRRAPRGTGCDVASDATSIVRIRASGWSLSTPAIAAFTAGSTAIASLPCARTATARTTDSA